MVLELPIVLSRLFIIQVSKVTITQSFLKLLLIIFDAIFFSKMIDFMGGNTCIFIYTVKNASFTYILALVEMCMDRMEAKKKLLEWFHEK
jgi:hypothetical protein